MWSETVKVVRQTDKVALCSFEDVEAWIPFSQILPDSEIYEKSQPGDEGTLAIPEWLAEQKEWMI
jgi:hypothetical protein